MHAIRLHAFGPPENLRYEEVPDPDPAPGQVRISVEASGVHLLDTSIRQGSAGGPFPLPELPMIPGREVAGRVDAVGPDVDASWLGRRVVAHLGRTSGGYARRAVSFIQHPKDPFAALHEIPDGLSAESAVAMIGTGRTAIGILDKAAITSEDVVLVTAAAGGLGSLLVQAARNAGALVVGVAGGSEKVDRVTRLGANVAVDYLEPDWPARVRQALGDKSVSVVLDGVGGASGRAALELLGMGGRILLFGWSAGEPTPITTSDIVARSLTASWAISLAFLQRPGVMRDLQKRALAEAASGRLVPVVHRFPLERASEAHAALESRATHGKVVLV